MMKKKIFIIASAMLVFGLAIAVYALNSTTASSGATVAACCCCSGDSCPVKDKNASSTTTTHENTDCCKGDRDSCPMRASASKSGDKTAAGDHSCPMMNAHKSGSEVKHDMKTGDAESCPMMNGDASKKMHAGKKHEMKADGTAGCSCACYADKKEKKDAPAV